MKSCSDFKVGWRNGVMEKRCYGEMLKWLDGYDIPREMVKW